MNDALGIALIGCGTVGTGVAQLLLERADRFSRRAGRPLSLRRVVVRDLTRNRDVPRELLGTDWQAAIHDPSVHVVVELVGGVDFPRQVVLAALAAGKHVVTANKALLAAHGPEVFTAAYRAERVVAFEASAAGGLPVVAALAQNLAANQIRSIQGILNGTSNFILSEMSDKGASYADVLSEAQQRGYAEADPTLDVDGSDAAHKLAILAQLAFGVAVPASVVERRGIAGIEAMDIRFASELGYTIKLLAEAWLSPDQSRLAVHVAPVLLRNSDLLAQVRGAYNALRVQGDVVGEMFFQGLGAGRMPTASAVLADLIDLAVGRAQRTFQTLRLWEARDPRTVVQPPGDVSSRFYLRLLVADRPGVLAGIAQALADDQVSISSVIQHEAISEDGGVVPLVIMTHAAPTDRFRGAVSRINQLPGVTAPATFYPVTD